MRESSPLDSIQTLNQNRKDNTLKLLSYFYMSYAILHVIGAIKVYKVGQENIFVTLGFYLGIVVYLIAWYGVRKGLKNLGMWIYVIEQYTHTLAMTHYSGYNLFLNVAWYGGAVLIFLTDYTIKQKFIFLILIFLLSIHLIVHGFYFSVSSFLINQPMKDVLVQHIIAFTVFSLVSYTYSGMVEKAQRMYQQEQELTQNLINNILPVSIGERLKKEKGIIVNQYDDVTILFADIVGFTQLTQKVDPEKLVAILNDFFVKMDNLSDKYQLEKIKTIGDSYMAVGGLPEELERHTEAVADMALELLEDIKKTQTYENIKLEIRIGINSGPVVAGVIGKRKFSYDLWGDAVNTAARMESHGETGKIHTTERVYQKLKECYEFEERLEQEIKGKGLMKTYFLVGRINN